MTYPYVRAAAQYGARKGPVKAFVVHMAEGGGTVGFLSRPNQRGVSVHYVIEYTGRIVQMVRETDASGSINPGDLRETDDASIYGATVAKKVMGTWWHDPNAAVISCEIEGFAKVGPNAAQHGSLKRLVGELRTRYPGIGLLGHRDFQDYKPCPGRVIHWNDLGGHGPAQEKPMRTYTIPDDAKTGSIRSSIGHKYLRLADEKLYDMPVVTGKRAFGPVRLTKGIGDDTDARSIGYLLGEEAAFVLDIDVTFTPDHGHARSTD